MPRGLFRLLMELRRQVAAKKSCERVTGLQSTVWLFFAELLAQITIA